jgi:hypothetical protein
MKPRAMVAPLIRGRAQQGSVGDTDHGPHGDVRASSVSPGAAVAVRRENHRRGEHAHGDATDRSRTKTRAHAVTLSQALAGISRSVPENVSGSSATSWPCS